MIAYGVGVILMALGCLLIGANWHCVHLNGENRRRGVDRHYSFVPFLGPTLAMLGLAAFVQRSMWLLIPWLADIATWSFVLAVPWLLRDALRRPRTPR